MDRIELRLKMEAETKKASDNENGTRTDVSEEYVKWLEKQVKNCSIPLVMPCTSFEHTAVDLKDGSTAVWTDGLSLNSDNDIYCQYKLESGKKYRVVLYEA